MKYLSLAVVAALIFVADAPSPHRGCASADEHPATAPADALRQARDRGVAWLLRQQALDGGWHSETYGTLQSGAGTTAIAVWSLSLGPREPDPESAAAIDRGLRFLLDRPDPQGLVQSPEGIADYPVYATALALESIQRRGDETYTPARQRLGQALLGAQRSEKNGWSPRHPDFGGWGATFAAPADGLLASRSNISVTAHALRALQMADALPHDAARDAQAFLARCQCWQSGPDQYGGFAFTARPDDLLNKAGWHHGATGEPMARPYRTATCDGLQALQYGVPGPSLRRTGARQWLAHHLNADRDGTTTSTGLSTGLAFYEAAALSGILHELDRTTAGRVRQELTSRLVGLQRDNGAWINPQTAMREDDPLIATSLALAALARLRDDGPP